MKFNLSTSQLSIYKTLISSSAYINKPEEKEKKKTLKNAHLDHIQIDICFHKRNTDRE